MPNTRSSGGPDHSPGKCYLGIDAGSTTTKLALINEHGDLLWSFYESNEGSPLNTVIRAMAKLQQLMPEGLKITYSCSTAMVSSFSRRHCSWMRARWKPSRTPRRPSSLTIRWTVCWTSAVRI